MYSIIETAGFQFKVEPGMLVKLPTVDAAIGSDLQLKSVLLASGKEVLVGKPNVADAVVTVEVMRHDRTPKVVIFKKKRRTRYERKGTHRQGFTEVLVKEIKVGAETASIDPKVVVRNRARATALAKAKQPIKKLTRKEKIAAGLPKPAKVKKNTLRKAKKEN